MSQRPFSELPEDAILAVNEACNRFEQAWQSGQHLTVEQMLDEVEPRFRFEALRELIPLEIEFLRQNGEATIVDNYQDRFPELDGQWLSELCSFELAGADTADADEPPPPRRLGDYTIVERIGGGGMGTVYKAIHERMGRTVALKVLRPQIQSNPDMLKRFDREVRAAARLSHVNIVAALDAREEDGVHCLITEFVDGEDLDHAVRKHGALSVEAAVDCLLQAARGLEYAHRQGVIHRDIKPANLLRDRQGVVKILDMGLARLDVDDSSATEMTRTGVMMGTAAYMAPEQARDTRRADARSDIYSLGCTLYFLLSGRLAFSGETVVDTILSHVNQPAPSLAQANQSIPQQLDEIFQRMVAKDPGDRFQSAAQLIQAVETLQPVLRAGAGQPAVEHMTRHQDVKAGQVPQTVAMVKTEVFQPTGVKPPPAVSRAETARAAPQSKSRARILIAAAAGFGLIVIASIVAAVVGSKGDRDGRPKPNYALAFDGESSYVAVPELEPNPNSPVTLELIVTLGEPRTSNMVSWLGPDWMAMFVTASGHWGLARRVGDESRLIEENQSPATPGRKVHLAGIWDGENLRLFIDGKPATTRPTAFPLPETSGGLYIGGVDKQLLPDDQNDRFFNGLIHAVRISKRVRYTIAFDPPDRFQVDDDALAVFEFNEGQGPIVRDATENAYQGRIVNAKWVLQE